MRCNHLATLAVGLIAGSALFAQRPDPSQRFVYPDREGKLVYDADARGNRIPDFSHCGYRGGGVPLPDVPVRVVVAPQDEDSTARIQAAVDYVSQLPVGEQGIRGAVLLLAGRHNVAGQIRIATSGVVLRGQGAGPSGTLLFAAGNQRRTLIRIAGKQDRQVVEGTTEHVREFVPVGSDELMLVSSASDLRIGDRVQVVHPSSVEWIAELGMNKFPSSNVGSWLDWKPATLDIHWERTITHVAGNQIRLDAPLTSALDPALGGGRIERIVWPGRIRQIGVENMRIESAFDRERQHDEEHAWTAIGLDAVQDCWVRQVTMAHFAGSAVHLSETCSQITVEDVQSESPVSELGGYRRLTFYTAGQRTLFQRCRSSHGRHDFAVGFLAAGPNAFVHCQAADASGFSGPIESWASGVLFDNVHIDGGGLSLTNRETDFHGTGWAAANCVLWQCTAPVITCRMPPTAQNWAIGCWGQFVGDGHWRSLNEFVKPESLYQAQLVERLGSAAVAATARREIPSDPGGAATLEQIQRVAPTPQKAPPFADKPITLDNGWLIRDGKLLAGSTINTVWWRGKVLSSRAGELGVGLTRFVPSQEGAGYTDDLHELTDSMLAKNQAALSHHWGLWYDRRRDDHQMIRRIDGDVWPPFYEQPWARSGQGSASDGLSKYDLTKFNPWYFGRLKDFADLCDQKGLLLVQQMYFQHNVLEAGAHWADFPWRPANCLQDTDFPEPPPYVNNKRIFMADAFYDVSHPVRRKLHQAYIRHCLETLGRNRNVIFMIGEEFTGPLEFVQFWLDTIAQWQQENGRKVLVGLSCTKDVQDAVLADAKREPLISVIDLKYWWYTADGGLYDPKGGQSLAPRQQLREWQGPKSRSDLQTARQIREYRTRFPHKAVVCSLQPASAWAVLAAGGSLPHLPRLSDDRLQSALPRMRPLETAQLSAGQWGISDPGKDYLIYALSQGVIRVRLPEDASFTSFWIDAKSGELRKAGSERSNAATTFRGAASGPAVLWITRDAR